MAKKKPEVLTTEELVRRVKDLAQHAQSLTFGKAYSQPVYFSTGSGCDFVLTEEFSIRNRTILVSNFLRGLKWSSKWGYNAVSEFVDKLIGSSVSNPDYNIEGLIKDKKVEFNNFHQSNLVRVPILGISLLGINSINLASARLFTMSEHEAAKIPILHNVWQSDNQKLNNQLFFEIEIPGDRNRVEQHTIVIVEDVLNFISLLFINEEDSKHKFLDVRMSSEININTSNIISSSVFDDSAWRQAAESVGYWNSRGGKLLIGANYESMFAYYGIDVAISAYFKNLRGEDLNNTEKIIMNCAWWLGDGCRQYNSNKKILSYISAAEALCSEAEGTKLSIATGLSMMSSSDPESRWENFNFIKDIYDLRSRITHGRGIDSEEDVTQYWTPHHVANGVLHSLVNLRYWYNRMPDSKKQAWNVRDFIRRVSLGYSPNDLLKFDAQDFN